MIHVYVYVYEPCMSCMGSYKSQPRPSLTTLRLPAGWHLASTFNSSACGATKKYTKIMNICEVWRRSLPEQLRLYFRHALVQVYQYNHHCRLQYFLQIAQDIWTCPLTQTDTTHHTPAAFAAPLPVHDSPSACVHVTAYQRIHLWHRAGSMKTPQNMQHVQIKNIGKKCQKHQYSMQ